MENKKFYWAILAMILVLGVMLIGCDTDEPDNGNDNFAGTWIGTETTSGYSVKIIAKDGFWTQWLNNNIESVRGTYTVSGNTVTIKYVEVNRVIFGGSNVLVFFAQLDETEKAHLGGSETVQINISGGTFTMLGATLNKQ